MVDGMVEGCKVGKGYEGAPVTEGAITSSPVGFACLSLCAPAVTKLLKGSSRERAMKRLSRPTTQ